MSCSVADVHDVFDASAGRDFVADVISELGTEGAFLYLSELDAERSVCDPSKQEPAERNCSRWQREDEEWLCETPNDTDVGSTSLCQLTPLDVWAQRRRHRVLYLPGDAARQAREAERRLLFRALLVADILGVMASLFCKSMDTLSVFSKGAHSAPTQLPTETAVRVSADELPVLHLAHSETVARHFISSQERSERDCLIASSQRTVPQALLEPLPLSPLVASMMREVPRHDWETVDHLLNRLVREQTSVRYAITVQLLGSIRETTDATQAVGKQPTQHDVAVVKPRKRKAIPLAQLSGPSPASPADLFTVARDAVTVITRDQTSLIASQLTELTNGVPDLLAEAWDAIYDQKTGENAVALAMEAVASSPRSVKTRTRLGLDSPLIVASPRCLYRTVLMYEQVAQCRSLWAGTLQRCKTSAELVAKAAQLLQCVHPQSSLISSTSLVRTVCEASARQTTTGLAACIWDFVCPAKSGYSPHVLPLELPADVLRVVFEMVTPKDVCAIATVCFIWRELVMAVPKLRKIVVDAMPKQNRNSYAAEQDCSGLWDAMLEEEERLRDKGAKRNVIWKEKKR